jgi:hypothetical protein
MTNLQAFNLSNLCGIAVLSNQLPFSVSRRLKKSSKVAAEIAKEVQEILALANEKKLSPEEQNEQILAFQSEEFKGNFEKIDFPFVGSIMPEMIKYYEGEQKAEKQIQLREILDLLDEHHLIVE